MPVKMVRWTCPNGEHPGVLGPSRPRKDHLCRYCIECSLKANRLVERVVPAIEGKREAARQRSAERAAKKRAKKIATGGQDDFPHLFTLSNGKTLNGEQSLLYGGSAKPIVEVRKAKNPKRHQIITEGVRRPRIVVYDFGGDRFDARAAVVVAELCYYGKHLKNADALKRYIRGAIRETIGVKFPLRHLKDAAQELAALLRAEHAVDQLGDPNLMGRGATGASAKTKPSHSRVSIATKVNWRREAEVQRVQ